MRFHKSIAILLVVVLVSLGLPGVSFAADQPAGAVLAGNAPSVTDMKMSYADCSECDTSMSCCATMDCPTGSHCVSCSALTGSSDVLASVHGNTCNLKFPDAIVSSMLVPAIYRPPWG